MIGDDRSTAGWTGERLATASVRWRPAMTTPRLRAARHGRSLGRRRRGRDVAGDPRARPATRDVTIVRNGSRGLLWLEPLVEVATRARSRSRTDRCTSTTSRRCSRPGSSPVVTTRSATDAPTRSRGSPDSSAGSPSRASAWSTRVSPDEYEATAGSSGSAPRPHDARRRPSATRSSSPGCAVAAAPASRPASSGAPCSTAAPGERFVCCNADEGDTGTFADRMLMEGDPFLLIEGMLIAAHVIGAQRGLRLHALRVPRRSPGVRARARRRGTRWLARRRGARQRSRLRHLVADRRGLLRVRRGDRDAREPRGQARRRPREAAAPCHRGSVRPADDRQQRPDARDRPADPGRRAAAASPTSASGGRAGRRSSSSPATSPAAASWRCRSGSRSASWSRTTAEAPDPGGRCARSRWEDRSARTCPSPCSTSRWTTRR